MFTRRTDTLSRHAGEISFPGGLVEQGEDVSSAALREAGEELGITPTDVELVGALPPVHTYVSGIVIAPLVGVLSIDPRYTPNAAEVAEILEPPLSLLASVGSEETFEREGRTFSTFVFPVDGHVIWGATGRILHSFIQTVLPAIPLQDVV